MKGILYFTNTFFHFLLSYVFQWEYIYSKFRIHLILEMYFYCYSGLVRWITLLFYQEARLIELKTLI